MNLLEELKLITQEKNIFVKEPMSKHTTFKTGGSADFFVIAQTREELQKLLALKVPKTIIGNGSNLLVKDGGIRGLVIKVGLRHYKVQDDRITVGAGMVIAQLSKIAYENSLSGLEFACGIPGTVGGAVVMNAGAYGSEMSSIVLETEVMDETGNITMQTEHDFGYRSSIYQKENKIILSANLKLVHGEQEKIKEQMDANMKARREKQPIDKLSAGSTFKRPKDNFAAKLIQDAGLKGYTIGDAMVSDLHAGFIINKGKATSKEILELMKFVQETVQKKYEIMLEPEVKIIGED